MSMHSEQYVWFWGQLTTREGSDGRGSMQIGHFSVCDSDMVGFSPGRVFVGGKFGDARVEGCVICLGGVFEAK